MRVIKLSRTLAALALLAALAPVVARASSAAQGDVPAWLRQAAASASPAHKKETPAVRLHDEAVVSVASDGRVTTTTTYAVRILTREGRGFASVAKYYGTDRGGKVREMRAWLIRPDASLKKYGKDETVDRIASSYDLYNESRVRQIDASSDAEVGAVFGYQTIVEDKPWFPQQTWWFQGSVPSLVSRLTLTLPAGWRAEGTVYNARGVEPAVTGTTYVWEMRGLEAIESEPASPSILTLAAHVAVKYFPPDDAAADLRAFSTWEEVSKWYTALAESQAQPDEAVSAKARELTAGARTDFEKIRAIGRYVQNLQYVSIQIGIGGFRPHAAREVFARQYGDCKDKATLMKAMLKAVGIESHFVLIYSGDRTRVRETWVSPGQFNHCIIAVRVGDDVRGPAVVQHPKLGRLLIFDATDSSTPVGELPDHEQGSFALIAAGEGGSLWRMPSAEPEANTWAREVEAGLAPDGAITAALRERLAGQPAADFRRRFKDLSSSDFRGIVERWLSGDASAAKLTRIEPADAHDEGRFALDVEFSSPAFAQSLQGRLLVFKPSVVARGGSAWLREPTRKHPVVLEAESFTETVRIKLPAGFEVDEIPDGFELNSEFGRYKAAYEIKDGHFVFTRTLVRPAATIPAEKYQEVRRFFGRVRASEESPVVLTRK
jgi:hypothetical protein